MAKGTRAGFFGERQPPAVLKHELLRQYVAPFAGMVGSTSPQSRVVFVDGYAGPGRYDNGDPGSPLLALETARALLPGRILECLFVEREAASFHSLQQVVREYRDQGVDCHAEHGSVDAHLARAITRAQGVPLFLFLDPCGVGISYRRLAETLNVDRAAIAPATEVLLNFSDKAVRHIGGQLRSKSSDRHGVHRLDDACGGSWWQDAYLGAADEEAGVQAVVDQFVSRLERDTNCMAVRVPVAKRPDLLPLYHLVFLTRRNHGLWVFQDALARAQIEWRAAQFSTEPDSPQENGVLFAIGDLLSGMEQRLRVDATVAVERNLADLLRRHRTVPLLDHVLEVFDGWYGFVLDPWVRQAVKRLHQSGLVLSDGRGARVRDIVLRRSTSG